MSKAEELVNWYLRLNGFLTISNFILHPRSAGSQRTDADIIGVRFPFRKEFGDEDCDDKRLHYHSSKPSIMIVEVKTQEIDINQAWQNPIKGNIEKVLSDLGFFQSFKIENIAKGLYDRGKYDDAQYYCSLLFIGNVDSDRIPVGYSEVPRILWENIIEFIYNRFRRFERIKTQHDQWNEIGNALYKLASENRSISSFEKEVRNYCHLPVI